MTPAERIAAMKARQDEQLRREAEEEKRREWIKAQPYRLIVALKQQLKDCDDVWLLDGETRGRCLVADRQNPPELRVLLRSVNVDRQLARFAVAGNFDTGDVYLTHDDDRVTHDQAVDLALATVEKYLYDESNNSGTVAKEESEIPL